MYGNAANTTDITANTLAASGNLPTAWTSGTSPTMTILTPSRATITLAPWASTTVGVNDGMAISVPTPSVSTCVALMTTTFEPGFKFWWAYGTATSYNVTVPPTPTQAQTQCSAATSPGVNLYFK